MSNSVTRRLRKGILLVAMLICSACLAFAVACGGSESGSNLPPKGTASVLVVGGAPDASLGNEGDLCFDSGSRTLYVKHANNWVQTDYQKCEVADNVLSVTYSDGSVENYPLPHEETVCDHEYGAMFVVYKQSCIVPGIGVQTCTKCGESYAVIIPADGVSHSLENGKCTICNQEVDYTTKKDPNDNTVVVEQLEGSEKTEITIPGEIGGSPVKVAKDAFKDNTKLTKVTIEGSVEVGESAFEGCSSLTTVIMQDGTKSIGANAFKGSIIEDVSIPASVTSIGADAFADTPYYEETNNWTDVSGHPSLINGQNLLKVKDSVSSVSARAAARIGGGGDYIVPKTTRVIADGAFGGISSLTHVSLPENLVTIGHNAFAETGLESVVLPTGITNLWGLDEFLEGIADIEFKVYYQGEKATVWTEAADKLTGVTVYYYSKEEPTTEGNFWHSEENKPAVWRKLVSLELGGEYRKEFSLGDTFSYEGLTVTAHYDDDTKKLLTEGEDGYTVDVSALKLDAEDKITATGEYAVKVTYLYQETTYSVKVSGFTVTVVYGNGDANTTVEVKEGENNYTLPEAPVFKGYTFLGWQVGDDAENPKAAQTPVTITENTTVTAKWQVKVPDITLELVGGSGTEATCGALEDGHYTVTVSGDPTRAGYRFAGWTVTLNGESATLTEGKLTVPLDDNMTVVITANWVQQFTVKFQYGNDQPEESKLYDINEPVTLPKPEQKKGYTFDGWYEGETAVGDTYTVTHDATLTAHWTAKTPNIEFNFAEGSKGSAEFTCSALTDGKYTVNVTGAPERDNCQFSGWTVTLNGAQHATLEAEGGEFQIDLDDKMEVVITAVWAGLHTVTVSGDHVTPKFEKDGPYVKGTEVKFTLEVAPGFKLAAENAVTAENAEITEQGGTYSVTVGESDILITVKTTKVAITPSVVDGDGATLNITRSDDGAKATITVEGTPHKTGYTFTNWTVAVNGAPRDYEESLVIGLANADITVTYTANWEIKEPSVSFSFPEGGSQGSANTSVALSEESSQYTITITGTPEYDTAHSFKEWTATLNGGPVDVTDNKIIVPLADNMTVVITAVWGNLYTVTAQGDHMTTSLEASKYYAKDAEVKFTVTVENGYKLVSVMNGETKLEAGEEGKYSVKVGDSNIVITVTTTKVEITLEWKDGEADLEGFEGIAAVHNGATATVTVTKTPAKGGYTFTGWTITVQKVGEDSTTDVSAQFQDGTLTLDLGHDDITVTFTANWTAEGLKIVKECGTNADGSQVYVESHPDGNQYVVTVSGTPTRTGYTFTGWTITGTYAGSLSTDGGTFNVLVAENATVTITAEWEVRDLTVTLNREGGDGTLTATPSFDPETEKYTVTLTGTLELENHRFDGWTITGADVEELKTLTGSFTVSLSEGMTVTIAAKWVEQVTVTYELGDHAASDANVPASETTDKGGTVTLPEAPKAAAGYEFAGWYEDETKIEGSTYKAENTVTLTAHWNAKKPSVTFECGNGAQQGTAKYEIGALVDGKYTITIIGAPVYDGHEFDGWTVTGADKEALPVEGGDLTVALSDEMIVTLTAKWKGYFTVTEESEHASITVDGGQSVLSGTTAKFTVTVDKGYKLLSVKNGEGTLEADQEGKYSVTVKDSNIVITIETTEVDVTVKFAVESERVEAQIDRASDPAKTTITVNGTPTKTGNFDFDGWTVKVGDDGAETPYTESFTLDLENADVTVTFTAKWKKYYTFTVKGDETDNATVTINDQKAKYYADEEITFTVEANNGYKLLSVKNGEAELGTNGTYTVTVGTENIVITVTTKAVEVNTNVVDGGGATLKVTQEGAQATITVNGTPAKEGFDFTGWTITVQRGEAGEPTDESAQFQGGSLTLDLGNEDITVTFTAKWVEHVEEFTVTYSVGDHAADGAKVEPESMKVVKGNSVTLPAAPKAAEGYEFAGWKVGSDETLHEVGYELTVTADVTVTAQWKAYYTLTIEGETENITVKIIEGRSENGHYYEGNVVKFRVNVVKGKYDFSAVNASSGTLEGPTDGIYTLTFEASNITLTVTTKPLYEITVEGKNSDQVKLIYDDEGQEPRYYHEGANVTVTIQVNEGFALVNAYTEGAADGNANNNERTVEITFGTSDVIIHVTVEKTHKVTFAGDTDKVSVKLYEGFIASNNEVQIEGNFATVIAGNYSLKVSLNPEYEGKYTIAVASEQVSVSTAEGGYSFTFGDNVDEITITITVTAIEHEITVKYVGLDSEDEAKVAEIISVEFTTDDKYTVEAYVILEVKVNQDYQNTYALNKVEATGCELNGEAGFYEFTVGTEDITITITVDRLYHVTVVTSDESLAIVYTLSSNEGYYKTGTAFTLNEIEVEEGYTLSVTAKGAELSGSVEDGYTFSVGTSDITITITATAIDYTITEVVSNATITYKSGHKDENKYHVGDKIEFTVEADPDYKIAENGVKIEGAELSQQDGVYSFTFGAHDVTITITTEAVVVQKYTVKLADGTEHVTLNGVNEEGYEDGTPVEFTLKLLEEGYGIKSVKNGDTELTEEGGKYSVTIEGADVIITVELYFYGTKDNPISVSELLVITDDQCTGNNAWTKSAIYVIGKVVANLTADGVEFEIADENETSKKIAVYKSTRDAEVAEPAQNDILVIYGWVENYNGNKLEFTGWARENDPYPFPQIISNERGESTIKVTNDGKATIEPQIPESEKNGTDITFKVTAPEGKKISSVAVNGETIQPDGEGNYKFTVHGNMEVVITVVDEGEVEEKTATLTFTADIKNSGSGTETYIENGITVTYTGGSTSGAGRFYASSSVTIAFTFPMKKIIFYGNSNDDEKYWTAFKNALTGDNYSKEVVDNDRTATITFTSSVTSVTLNFSAQARLSKIDVIYDAKPQTDEDKVNQAFAEIEEAMVAHPSESSLTVGFKLPTTSVEGVEVEWSIEGLTEGEGYGTAKFDSVPPTELIITQGTVETTFTLKCVIKCGGVEQETATFNYTIPAKSVGGVEQKTLTLDSTKLATSKKDQDISLEEGIVVHTNLYKSNAVIQGASGTYLYNTTPLGLRIVSVVINYASQATAKKATIQCSFGTSQNPSGGETRANTNQDKTMSFTPTAGTDFTYFKLLFSENVTNVNYIDSITITYEASGGTTEPGGGDTSKADLQKAQDALDGLTIESSVNEDKTITLPAGNDAGVTYNWTLVDGAGVAELIGSNSLKITRTTSAATVKLSATATYNGQTTEKKDFTIQVSANSGGGSETGQTVWKLVTDVSTLQAGDKIVFVSGGYTLGAYNQRKYFERVEVKLDSASETLTELPTTATIITLAGEADAWIFKIIDEKGGETALYLPSAVTSNNQLEKKALPSSITDSYKWTISSDEKTTNGWFIQCKGGGNNSYLRYNGESNGARFSNYKQTSQASPFIYVQREV